jgi:hypothetical protein
MPRRYYRRYRRAKRKYSVEQHPVHIVLSTSTTSALQVVAPSATEGMRKVKNVTVNLVPQNDINFPVFWALVYVPEGTQPGALNTSSSISSLYEPNQFVMNCGIVDATAGPIRFFTPLARNLNSGDAIYLLLTSSTTETPLLIGTTRYAIAY